jgi:3',5'-cyclic AMP phosphodiesterase CpdA
VTATRTAPLVVAHVSDLHLGAHDRDAVATLADEVAAVRPALTVVTGDSTMRARPHEFRAARALLDRLPAPLLVVLGNHDVPLSAAVRLTAPYRRYQRWLAADLDPVVRLPGLTALGLQSMPRWRWKSGRVSRRQSEAVRGVLGAAPPGTVRLLALHHPPRARGLERVIGRDRLLRSLGEAHVDLVLAGHTHLPSSGPIVLGDRSHQPVEVIAGTATSRRTRGRPRSWTVLRIDDDSVEVTEHSHTAAGWQTARVVRHRRG